VKKKGVSEECDLNPEGRKTKYDSTTEVYDLLRFGCCTMDQEAAARKITFREMTK
jgi:hypothetical protein